MSEENSRSSFSRFIRKRRQKLDSPPGKLVYIGEEKQGPVDINIIDYNRDDFNEFDAEGPEQAFDYQETGTVTWIDVDGLHDTEVIDAIGDHYGIHPLTREDVVNTDQRPKMEDLDDYIFVQLKMLQHNSETHKIESTQVSLLIGQDTVISFQEKGDDVFDPVRKRIREGKGQIRRKEADYLAYALIDAVVDNYFLVLERIGDRIEEVESRLTEDPDTETLQDIHDVKRELIFLRKSVWPLRDVIGGLERTESDFVSDDTRKYLRDVHDHTVQVIDIVETFRDMASGTLDIYMSSVSNKMNEVMKVLTIIATVFIPLTFIAGVYGMNFDPGASPLNMPELGWYYGYPVVMALMGTIALAEIIYFRKKGWL